MGEYTAMITKIRTYLRMIKFEHTLFALPFALTSAVVAVRGLPAPAKLGWILLAMFGARSTAMGFNRIVDRRIDALNPRTQNRELPAGKISLAAAVLMTCICASLFVLAAGELNRLAFYLSFPALLVICGYSFTKRFTAFSHFVLGLSLGLAPLGAWIALRGSVSHEPLLLGLAVLFWVAGFDIIYATMDDEFDRKMGLHSMVQRLGVVGGLNFARLLHLGFLIALAGFGIASHLRWPFLMCVLVITAMLVYEHAMVGPEDLSRVNMAFFTVNGIISVLILIATSIDLWVQHL